MRAATARRLATATVCAWLAASLPATAQPEPGLLFHLSGSQGLTADHAANGRHDPNFAADVRIVEAGAVGPGIECDHTQLLSYWAPGNIYAEHGTLAFFWRAREPVGPTEFPVFRVGYADHSSWDMVWLRIDYNGKPGFDAFVTDASLARTRVSHALSAALDPARWIHLALAWDETTGIRFYVDGRLVDTAEATAVYHAALDQFGPHSRIISPYQVQSRYNFVRGGDIDELRIYDRMLSDANVAALARGEAPGPIPPLARDLDAARWRDAWWLRHGWNRPGDVPPRLEGPATTIRKVEIHDVYDVKRWWWKATDGIRETTWPGVYNRSRLPGRLDYFVLPDWDCYSISGKEVTFHLPDEPWNHLEVSGAAFGAFSLLSAARDEGASGRPLFERPEGQERTSHRLDAAARGGRLRFVNVEQETPIGELSAYHIAPGGEPEGVARLTYRLGASSTEHLGLDALVDFIAGRFAPDERRTLVALPAGVVRTPRPTGGASMPLVHVLVPADVRDIDGGRRRATTTYSWINIDAVLDGIAIDLPALDVEPTHGDVFPMNIQVKDPIWPLRNLLDVNVSVTPGQAHTLWLDTRDRLLPHDRGLYLTMAGAGGDFGAASLEGAEIRLIFKAREQGLAEHVLDRFTQVRDNYAHLVEETPRTRRLTLFTRFEADMIDLFRADAGHELGRQYWYDANREQPRPAGTLATPPPGVPLWAFRQVELQGHVKRFVNWYIDHRQIENGEFGGGLSDDGDLTNWWPGTALVGANPAKVLASLRLHMEAYYDQGLFTNGLSTIQTDELHSYEEGIQVLGQSLLADFGNPRHLERAMETARAIEGLTGVNAAGHRHIRSIYFSGTRLAEEGVWGWSKSQSYLILHPAIALVDYNGSPRIRTLLVELADGLLAHRRRDEHGRWRLHADVEFATDRDLPTPLDRPTASLLWAAWRWTGDEKYLAPFEDHGPASVLMLNANVLDLTGRREAWGRALLDRPARTNAWRHAAWQLTGDTSHLEQAYADQSTAAILRWFINTEGSLWIDRVSVEHGELQRSRLGGVAIVRNGIVPGHVVSWDFGEDGRDEHVALLVQDPTRERARVVGFNLSREPVSARMTAWDLTPGLWELTQGTAADTTAPIGADRTVRRVEVDRGSEIEVSFAPGVHTVLEWRLVEPGTPSWSRPDLGLSREGLRIEPGTVVATVHSLGGAASPAARLEVRDREGRLLGQSPVPPLPAPDRAEPVSAEVRVPVPAGANLAGGEVVVVPAAGVREITRRNDRVGLE